VTPQPTMPITANTSLALPWQKVSHHQRACSRLSDDCNRGGRLAVGVCDMESVYQLRKRESVSSRPFGPEPDSTMWPTHDGQSSTVGPLRSGQAVDLAHNPLAGHQQEEE